MSNNIYVLLLLELFSEPFCEMHSVVTVKTVVHFNHANIFCTTRNKIRCRQFVMRSRTIYQKTEGIAETESERYQQCSCDEKSFLKENVMLVNQPSESANTREVWKKGDWKRTILVNAMIRIFFCFEKQNMMLVSNHANQQATDEGRQKVKKKKKKLNGNTACECDDKTFFERQNMMLLITSSQSLHGPTPQLTDKLDRAIRGNTNQVLQRCAALVRRIKLWLQGQTAMNFGAQLCGIQDNKCARVVRTEALCHGCLHILPRWPRQKSSQPQVQETDPLLERWMTHQPPTHQTCMPAPAAATRAWSSNGSTARAAGLQGSPLPAYQHLSRSFCLFPRSQHTFGWGFSPLTQYPTLSREVPTGRQTIQKWMPQLIIVFFHVLREYARAQLWAGILTFEEASWRSISSSRFLCSSICFLLPQALRELVSPSDWAAAAAAPASAMASCFFFLISRARSAPEARRSISAQWGERGGSVKTNGLEKKLKLEADDSERQASRFPWSLQCFCIFFCLRSALATAWQPRACPLANPDNNR